jgi:hypothetical protein
VALILYYLLFAVHNYGLISLFSLTKQSRIMTHAIPGARLNSGKSASLTFRAEDHVHYIQKFSGPPVR